MGQVLYEGAVQTEWYVLGRVVLGFAGTGQIQVDPLQDSSSVQFCEY